MAASITNTTGYCREQSRGCIFMYLVLARKQEKFFPLLDEMMCF